jgi:hypothetical protein
LTPHLALNCRLPSQAREGGACRLLLLLRGNK